MRNKDWKYEVEVIKLNRAMKVDKALTEELRGLSKKMITRMKKEAVNCPVLGKKVAFIQCYLCPNFIRRIRGIVYCRGNAL